MKTEKCRRATIQLGNIPLDVFMLPDSTYVLSQVGIERAVNKGERSYRNFLASKSPEALPWAGSRTGKLAVLNENEKTTPVPIAARPLQIIN
jgi:hypothetical protein